MKHFAGRMWVDESSFQIVRLDMQAIHDVQVIRRERQHDLHGVPARGRGRTEDARRRSPRRQVTAPVGWAERARSSKLGP